MADTATSRGRLRKQTLASNVNIWGDPYLNTNFDLLDQQIDGVTTIALGTSTGTTLTSTNYAIDQQRNKAIVFTGTGTQTCTATVPQVEQVKLIANKSSGPVVIAPAAGTAVTVAAGERALIYCDGTNFDRGDPTLDKVRAPTASVSLNSQRITNLADPSALQDAATKNYVDLSMTSGAAGATFLTVSTNSVLQNERVLTPASNELYLSAGTAGGAATIGLATDTVAFGTRALTGGTWGSLQVAGTATASALSVSGTSTTAGLAVSSAVSLPSAGVATAALASTALRALGPTTPAADTVPYFAGTASAGTTAFTSFARTLLAGTDAAAMRSTLVALGTAGDGSAVTVTPTGGAVARTLASALAGLYDDSGLSVSQPMRLSARLTGNYTPVYDLSSSTLASMHCYELGSVNVPSGKQYDVIRVTGTNSGAGKLFGYHFDLTASGSDTEPARGVIGRVTVSGSGPGKAIRVGASGSGSSTAHLAAVSVDVTPVATNGTSNCFEGGNFAATGVDDIAQACEFFSPNGARWRNGIVFEQGNEYQDAVLQASMGSGSATNAKFLKLKNAAAANLFEVDKTGSVLSTVDLHAGSDRTNSVKVTQSTIERTASAGSLTVSSGSSNGLYLAGGSTGVIATRAGSGAFQYTSSGFQVSPSQITVVDTSGFLILRSYTVATLPSASNPGRMIYVSDGTSNQPLAVSDGTNWRFPSGSIVS